MVEQIMGTAAKPDKDVDPGVLALVAAIDPENAEAFGDMSKAAMESLATKLLLSGKKRQEEINEKEIAEQVKTQVENIRHAEKTKLKLENERNWFLTPDSIRKLLPGAGTIANTFYMQCHPIADHFRADYVLGEHA